MPRRVHGERRPGGPRRTGSSSRSASADPGDPDEAEPGEAGRPLDLRITGAAA
jgi:hypothetical protein